MSLFGMMPAYPFLACSLVSNNWRRRSLSSNTPARVRDSRRLRVFLETGKWEGSKVGREGHCGIIARQCFTVKKEKVIDQEIR
jgi:hypothetical protein